MDTVLRAVGIYFVLLLVFRIAGNRSLAQITMFDFVLLLIISESSQQGITANDYSFTNAVVLISTLVLVDVLLSLWKQRSEKMERLLDGMPLILVRHGEVLQVRLDKVRVDQKDILEAARELQGIERLDQIKYAVLERGGEITIIPWEGSPAADEGATAKKAS
ncbi:MAG TPA: YetF domain-containing protein [Terriglobia bacterium]|nr:YetF domain-containing protein [Terriglobia bacterium]